MTKYSTFLTKWELYDVWRLQNPTLKRFTRRQIGCQPTRIDYFFSTLNLLPLLNEVKIGIAYLSDHSPLSADLVFGEAGPVRLFKFPVDLCFSDTFRAQLNEALDHVEQDNPNADPLSLWDVKKSTIRSTAIKFKCFQKKIRKEIIESYESKIARETMAMDKEESLLLQATHKETINRLHSDLNNMFQDSKSARYARNLARWYSEKDCPTKYFLTKFKLDKDRPVISQLITARGTITSNSAILKEAHSFYSQLYSSKPVILPTEDIDETPILSEENIRLLSEDITEAELYQALKSMRSVSAPGMDGITVKFYLHFWDLVKGDLLQCFRTAFEAGSLNLTQRQGLLKLLPKKNRNLLFLPNWRGITLLNVDFKLITKVLSRRLKHILPEIIHPDQRGFVHGRRLSNGILDIYALLDLLDDEEKLLDFLVCSIDIEKAFDSLSWDFVRYTLNKFGFPQSFLKWFDVCYNNKQVYIMNNGELSQAIDVTRGNAQGCPLSPLLFVLAIEILAIRIRNNNEITGITVSETEKKLNLVADDVLIMMENTYSGCEALENELGEFSLNSGLSINLNKSTVSRFSASQEPLQVDRLPTVGRDQKRISYVGFSIPIDNNNFWDANMPTKLAEIIAELQASSEIPSASLLGKITAIRSLFFSRLPYFLERLPLPDKDIIKLFQSALKNIVWSGKQPKMRLENASAPLREGGFNMIDFEARLNALKIASIQLACNTSCIEFWQEHLFRLFTVPFDTLVRSNVTFNQLKHFVVANKNIPPFWSDALQVWCKYHYRNCSSKLSSDEDYAEVLNRPAPFNGAFAGNLQSKRFSPQVQEYFFEHGWFTVLDVITVGATDFPVKGFVPRSQAEKIISTIPLNWKQHVDKGNASHYSLAQKMIDQRTSQQEIHHKLLKSDFRGKVALWAKAGINVNWEKVSANITRLKHVPLKSFFLQFNSQLITLNNCACRFAPVSPLCSFCSLAEETYLHLFWECQKIQPVWNYVHSLIPDKTLCTKEMCLLPTVASTKVVVLFTLAKYYLHICKFIHRPPNVYGFTGKLRFHMSCLKSWYADNNNSRTFDRTFGSIFSDLQR